MNLRPLAYRIRPNSIDEVIGQSHLVGQDGILRKSIENKTIFSIIFYGPPGAGKTTIAEAYAKSMGIKYIKLNAVTSSKKDLENAIEECKLFDNAYIIMDEVHRLNKDKQDILLPFVEEGSIYLLGCTAENPYMVINKALRSRCHLLEVKTLSEEDIYHGLVRAIDHKQGLKSDKKFSKEALKRLATLSGGDMRYALNYLEVINISTKNKVVKEADVLSVMQVPNYLMDSNEGEHYDSVSAFQKSIRGSDVDAALFYLARLIAVNDMDSIIRRLLVTAYEDVGLANPQAVDRTYNACMTALRVGFPEAKIPLAFAVTELALSPKSKQACLGIENALEYIKGHPLDIMDYLRLTPVNVSEEDKYPYDRPDLWNKIQYLPESIKDIRFYEPNKDATSSYEIALNSNYHKLKSIKSSSSLRTLKKVPK